MKFVDLSHPMSNAMPTYPSDPDISIIREKDIDTDNSLLHSFKMGTHTGTHLDVPAHVIPGGKTIDNFTLSSFTGSAVKVDKDSYYSLDQVIDEIDGVVYDSGWYRHFNDPEVFYGPDRLMIPEKLIEKAVEMKIKFFGCDSPSVDVIGSKEKPAHHALLGSDIIIYESLNNLHQLPLLTPFEFYGFPLPFNGLDGSPVRAVGII
ncbi:MAG: cyclase family protein [Candidatus Marinimicrobia bacterium]|nr:cyclase family protein [Candidatus Neomarinimicrobiota bacterium]